MQHHWSVLCQSSVIDIDSNLLSLYDCLEELNVNTQNQPGVAINLPINFEVVSFLSDNQTKSNRKLTIKAQLLDPKGKQINEFGGQLFFKEGSKRLRSRLKIQGLTLSESGVYIMRLHFEGIDGLDFKADCELPLEINISYKIL
ncbi:MAG: hypothetical protein PHE20_01725 [Patescibacteria group bacterium]|nr:hypothetical protein [Patescibacteria group bacterium]